MTRRWALRNHALKVHDAIKRIHQESIKQFIGIIWTLCRKGAIGNNGLKKGKNGNKGYVGNICDVGNAGRDFCGVHQTFVKPELRLNPCSVNIKFFWILK